MLTSKPIIFNTPKSPKQPSHPSSRQLSQNKTSEADKEEAQETKKLDHLVEKTHEVLYKVSAVWLFDLFPDELVITLHQITLIRRSFFGSESISAISTDELTDVSEESTPFFTALRLKPQGKEPVLIKFLPPKQGKEAGKILHGIVGCNKANIDLLKLDVSIAKEKIQQLGEVKA